MTQPVDREGDDGQRLRLRLAAFWEGHRETVLDFTTGLLMLVALSLLLNRGMFGFDTMQGWTVNYGNF